MEKISTVQAGKHLLQITTYGRRSVIRVMPSGAAIVLGTKVPKKVIQDVTNGVYDTYISNLK